MPATVEGMFKIIDGASTPMRRMERQAEKTDSSIEKLGERLDNVGSDKQLKQMGDVDRQIKTIDRDARSFSGNSGGGGRLRKTLSGAGDDADNLNSKLINVGLSLASVGKIFAAMKLPLMAAGIVALVQGVSALAGGLVALLPKLTDVLGVAGAIPAAVVGIGIAAVSTKLALGGLGAALKGTKGAMADLTPRAREFVRVMREMKPLGNQLRNSAQAGLFPGLTSALGSLKKGAPTANRLLRRGGETVGGIADRAAGQITQKGFLADLESVGNQGLTVVNRLGTSLMNVVQALRHVAVAAEPFTDWLSTTIVGWTEFWKESSLAGRRSGELASYFDRTRAALETFGSILHSLWDTFKGISAAARPLGEDLWSSADKATEKWAKFTNSVTGRVKLRNYFDGLHDSIDSIFRFVSELGTAFAKLGGSGGFASTADALTKAVEPLGHVMEVIGDKWGPKFAVTIEQLIRLFDNLASGTSGFSIVVDMLNMFLEAVNGLLEKIPGLTKLLTVVLAAVTFQRIRASLLSVAEGWNMVAMSAERAAVAQQAATGVPGAPGGLIPGQAGAKSPWFGKGGSLYNTQKASFVAPASGAATAMNNAPGFFQLGGRGMMGAGRSAMGRALGAAGRFIGPAYLGMGAISALTANTGDMPGGSAGNRLDSFVDPFGMFQAGPTSYQAMQQRAQAEAASGLSRKQVKRRMKNVRSELGKGGLSGLDEVLGGGDASLFGMVSTNTSGGISDAERSQLEQRLKYLGKTLKMWQRIGAAKSKALGEKEGNELQGAFGVYRKHGSSPLEALEKTLDGIPRKMRGMNDKSQQELLRTTSVWARAFAKGNPKMMAEVEKLERGVEDSFDRQGKHISVVNGNIMRGTQSEWKGIRTAMTDEAEKARQEVSTSFTKLQKMAVGSLTSMGYSPQAAKKIIGASDANPVGLGGAGAGPPVAGPPAPGKKGNPLADPGGPLTGGARGIRIPGTGTHDTVGLGHGAIGAPGELIVNQHTENDVNSILSRYGTSLGGMVGKEGRPHSEVSYARGGRRTTAGGGGMAGVASFAASMGLNAGEGPGEATPGVHTGGSLHYAGLAYDVSGAPASMMAFRKAAEQRYLGHGLNELFYDPFSYYIDEGNKVPGSIGGHSDHVHIGFFPGGPNGAGAIKGLMGGAMGAGFKPLKTPKSKLSGLPGGLANAAMGGMTAGLNKKIAGKAGMSATGGAMMPNFKGGGGNLTVGQLQKLAGAAGMANPHLMAAIGMAESGGDPTVTNSIGARGLWQIIPSTAAAFGLNYNKLTNPAYNAFGAAKILAGQGLGAWEGYTNGAYSQYMAKGGRLGGANFAGWFKDGGTVEASSPTMLGIGDGVGTEVAKITPKRGGRAGQAIGGVTIGQMHISYNRPGDAKKQIKKEVHEAFSELANELDLTPDTDDDEVLA